MRYVSMGRVPAKRHTQVYEDGRLLVEEVMMLGIFAAGCASAGSGDTRKHNKSLQTSAT